MLMNFLTSFQEISLSVAAPPGIPPSQVQLLRQAFMRTMRDEAYLADMRKLNMSIAPKSGDEIAKVVEAVLEVPPEILEKAKRIFDK
jgi:tripartite-type tricarboxylate transporter receptor subunit TctC